MKRLGRWLVRIAVALSLVLAVTTRVLWVRSYRHGDRFLVGRANIVTCPHSLYHLL